MTDCNEIVFVEYPNRKKKIRTIFVYLLFSLFLIGCNSSKSKESKNADSPPKNDSSSNTTAKPSVKLENASASDKKVVKYKGLSPEIQKVFESKIDNFYKCLEKNMKERLGAIPVYAPMMVDFNYEANIISITSLADMEILRPYINNGLTPLKTRGIYAIRNSYVGITNMCMSLNLVEVMQGLYKTHPDLAPKVLERNEIHTIYKNNKEYWQEVLLCGSNNNCFVGDPVTVMLEDEKNSIYEGKSSRKTPEWYVVDSIKGMDGKFTENYAALKFWEIQP